MKKNNASLKDLRLFSQRVRRDILYYSYLNHTGHISSCLSITDILSVLYGSILNIDPKSPTDRDRDRFILSKGHAALALYCTLSNKGFFPKSELNDFCHIGSKFGTHPEHGIPGIELSTGSLGHGLSVGAGMALSAKQDKKNFEIFVLISDAELNEGSIWEAIEFCPHHKLDNLTLIIDKNGLQAFGKTKDVLNLGDVSTKLKDFGWSTFEVDGHDHKQIFDTLKKVSPIKESPKVIVAKTIGGSGVPFMEGKLEWHYNNLNENQYKSAIKEIGL